MYVILRETMLNTLKVYPNSNRTYCDYYRYIIYDNIDNENGDHYAYKYLLIEKNCTD